MAVQPPITGLSQLGGVLADVGQTVARRNYGLQDEERRRAGQLADIESARAYQDAAYARQRGDAEADRELAIGLALAKEGRDRTNQLSDIEQQRVWQAAQTLAQMDIQLRAATIADMAKRGLLSPAEAKDPAAIAKAYATFAQQSLTNQENAQAFVNRAAREAEGVRQQMSAVEQELNSPAPTLDPRAIEQRALELARVANPGKTPSRADIEANIATATDEMNQAATLQWYQRKESARQQYNLLNSQLQNLSASVRQFNVAPSASVFAEPVAAAAPVAAPIAQLTAEQKAAAARAAAGIAEPVVALDRPAAPPVEILSSPYSDPLIDAANQQRLLSGAQNEQRLFEGTLTDEDTDFAKLLRDEQSLRRGYNPNASPFGGGFGIEQSAPVLTPDAQGELLTRNLQAQAARLQSRQKKIDASRFSAESMGRYGAPADVASRYGL